MTFIVLVVLVSRKYSLLFLGETKVQQKEKVQLHFLTPELTPAAQKSVWLEENLWEQHCPQGRTCPDLVYALGLVAAHGSLAVLPSWQFLLSADLSRLKYSPVITLIISIIPDPSSPTQE